MTDKSKEKNNLESPKKRLRALVFRSNKAIYCQIIDISGNVLVSASSKEIKESMKPIEKAFKVGKKLAELALDKKIKMVFFDRNGYRYHGQVKSLADGLREGKLEF